MAHKETSVWLITGSSAGLGLALTRHVLAKGHKVVATSRNPSKVSTLAEEVESQGGKWLPLDLTADNLEEQVKQAEEVFGRIDVLVNCGAYALMGSVEDTPMTRVIAQMDTNFNGPVRIIKTLLPTMRKRRSGTIVNVSSSQSFLPSASTSIYGASKAALDAFSDSLSQEVKDFGIKVLLVSPGAFRTNFATTGADKVTSSEEYAKKDHPVTQRITWMDTLPKMAKGSPELGAKVMYEAVTGDYDQLRLIISAGGWRAAKLSHEKLGKLVDSQEQIAASADSD